MKKLTKLGVFLLTFASWGESVAFSKVIWIVKGLLW